ncbi:hypothetical protein QUF54_06625 [Candidatus Marithioploca araucensis]|uniref:Uncharacterized protein n=1 Tax=Candidatus Marithioploca araucensis TaxID=70273 RepID=A0ABT7VTU9_9GAMM|nr:hypothetical protein [Candidatus Marithioploca araucensis]
MGTRTADAGRPEHYSLARLSKNKKGRESPFCKCFDTRQSTYFGDVGSLNFYLADFYRNVGQLDNALTSITQASTGWRKFPDHFKGGKAIFCSESEFLDGLKISAF